jgi:hypothetical protein
MSELVKLKYCQEEQEELVNVIVSRKKLGQVIRVRTESYAFGLPR